MRRKAETKVRTRYFPHTATQAAFLLGGIGTGNISLGSRGDLLDWEIFNKPAKGLKIPYSFFAVCSRNRDSRDGSHIARILEAPMQPPYANSHGFNTGMVAGLPHMMSSELAGEYPFARVVFRDPDLPMDVALEAFTPFVPLNADESGIPGAILRYSVRNRSGKPLVVSIAGSLPNVVGFKGFDSFNNLLVHPGGKNLYRDEGALRGLFYSNSGLPPDSLPYGTMALVSTGSSLTCKESWLAGGWFDGIQDFWDDFSTHGRLSHTAAFHAPGSRIHYQEDRPIVGSLCLTQEIGPRTSAVFEFLITWHFPNRLRGWHRDANQQEPVPVMKNHYALRFADAWAVASYLVTNLARLEELSRRFHRALYTSTLPPYVIDALASNITVLRSPTCFRLEDGTFVSWEGCHDTDGCCDGSCTHVWNYTQSLAFLFPELERSMRRVEFNVETDDEGRMAFRARRILGLSKWDMLPAADGQLGAVVRLYRDWKLCGDDDFLRSLWKNAARALDFAFDFWDSDGDCVLDSEQHNTYDIEFYGPNSLTGSIFLAALKAGAAMAAHLGDEAHRARYEDAFQRGSARLDSLLWSGEYYVQLLQDVNAYRYQYGTGCLSDQLLGQLLAHVAGLGYVLPEEHVRKAIKSVYKRNFLKDLRGHVNAQRTYVLDGEAGLLLCTWPHGGRPRLPFVYCDEVWTGIEYQVAAHLIYEGHTDEGLEMVKAVRDRHDGFKRNPWNEVECGHHYVRSLASWSLLPALSGFRFDMTRKRMSFAPAIPQAEFSCFFSTGAAWGIYRERVDAKTRTRTWDVEPLYGNLDGVTINDGKGT
ncbi:MAG: GH116 family glycosyl-hydrolase [Spirochaetia bacterium]|jgi:uncharacterized protein (DUF608 family)